MPKGVNKVILVGHLGEDPLVKYMPSGGAVTNFSVATTDSWKDKASGETVDSTEWHRVVFFNGLAEIAGDNLKKGSKIYIEGSLRTRKWKDQGGHDRYTTEVIGAEMQMMGGSGGGSAQSNNASSSQRTTSRNAPPRTYDPPASASDKYSSALDDDIPM